MQDPPRAVPDCERSRSDTADNLVPLCAGLPDHLRLAAACKNTIQITAKSQTFSPSQNKWDIFLPLKQTANGHIFRSVRPPHIKGGAGGAWCLVMQCLMGTKCQSCDLNANNEMCVHRLHTRFKRSYWPSGITNQLISPAEQCCTVVVSRFEAFPPWHAFHFICIFTKMPLAEVGESLQEGSIFVSSGSEQRIFEQQCFKMLKLDWFKLPLS